MQKIVHNTHRYFSNLMYVIYMYIHNIFECKYICVYMYIGLYYIHVQFEEFTKNEIIVKQGFTFQKQQGG